MAINKNALIRYQTIDKCLQNQFQKWTLNDLISACSNALYEFEGIDTNISKRTIQLDIQMLRSDKLGYNAPIVVYEKRFYKYSDPEYSINNTPFTKTDMSILTESVQMLKQFKNFSLFSDLGGIINKLEDKIYSESKNNKPIIYIDKNESLKGLKFLDIIYQAILKKIVLIITYKSFKARKASDINFTPYILKEYNNRWFLIGRVNINNTIRVVALDRIENIDYDLNTGYYDENFNGETYFENTIGVTVLNRHKIRKITLKIDSDNAPYVITKPFHKTQNIIDKLNDGSIIIEILVHQNNELTRLILGFGDSIEVLKPNNYRKFIAHKIKNAATKYNDI